MNYSAVVAAKVSPKLKKALDTYAGEQGKKPSECLRLILEDWHKVRTRKPETDMLYRFYRLFMKVEQAKLANGLNLKLFTQMVEEVESGR